MESSESKRCAGEWWDGKVAKGNCRVEPDMQTLGWSLGSMDDRGNERDEYRPGRSGEADVDNDRVDPG